MTDFAVTPEELHALAGLMRGLKGELDQPLPLQLAGGAGTPEVEDGFFTMAGHCGSRMRHMARDIEEIAEVIEAAAAAYDTTEASIVTAASGAGTVEGSRS